MARGDLAVRVAAACAALSVTLSFCGDAGAFCRATTCDEKSESCRRVNGCVVDGIPLFWASRCLSFGVQKDGSPKRGISYRKADDIVRQAFAQWTQADCGGGRHPSFQMWDLGDPHGGVVCDVPEFNEVRPNANVWMFRDDDWPYEPRGKSNILALTATMYDTSTGALLDADVEINSFGVELTTTDVNVKKDLASIVTHEAGHFLGLGHSTDPQATMYDEYTAGDLNYRSLHPDDMRGICTVYPPDRDAPACRAPSPPHGFSIYCGNEDEDPPSRKRGCTVAASPVPLPADGGGAALGIALASIALVARRRR